MKVRFITRPPTKELRGIVKSLWFLEGATPPHAVERRLPSAEAQLLFNLSHDSFRWFSGARLDRSQRAGPALLSGPSDTAFGIDPRDQSKLLGVVLHVGAAPVVLGLPMTEVANTQLDLGDIVATESLYAELIHAADPRAALHLVEQWLLSVVHSSPDAAMTAAVAQLSRGALVSEVADHAGLSTRGLRRRFSAAVGLSPKRFAGLARFQRVIHDIAKRPPTCWATFAYAHGFFDQAHLIRDVRAFSGLTPATYLPRSADVPMHVVER